MANRENPVIVDGIELKSIRLDVNEDIEFMEALADSEDPELDDGERLRAAIKLFRTVFGTDYPRIKRELRAKNGGELTIGQLTQFMAKTIKAVAELKN